MPRTRPVMEAQSPELVLVAPPELRAAALAALTPTRAAPVAVQEPELCHPAAPLLRHPDLDRFGFLSQVPEREPDRSWLRLDGLAAVSGAIVLGAAAPVLVALLVR